jgi:CheY-like chemotaxis protein
VVSLIARKAHVMVPREPAADEMARPAPIAPQKRILCMDDDPSLRRMFLLVLKMLGYDPVCVAEGDAVLSAYASAFHDGLPFALVVLDLHNTCGMGGELTLGALRDLDPQVKVIVCSGDHYHPVFRQYHDYGFSAALRKPFELEEFRDLLQQFV